MVRFALMSACAILGHAGTCPDDPNLDLCDGDNSSVESDHATRQMSAPTLAFALAIVNGFGSIRGGGVTGPLLMSAMMVPARAASAGAEDKSRAQSSCANLKAAYKAGSCCGEDVVKATTKVPSQVIPAPGKLLGMGANPCEGKKPGEGAMGGAFDNIACAQRITEKQFEQAGVDISQNSADRLEAPQVDTVPGDPVNAAGDRWPIMDRYWKGNTTSFKTGPLCPVNVHWHLGTEHRSKGQFDEAGKSPKVKSGTVHDDGAGSRRLRGSNSTEPADEARQLAGTDLVRYGFACHHYDKDDIKWTTEYNWQHCVDMQVGATYEVHWPHSILGACNTPWQYQSPFYDGVFCGMDFSDNKLKTCAETPDCLSNAVGVQGQVFTIINDEAYYYPHLIKGMIVNAAGNFGQNVAVYTGSSTGTSRDNTICSPYAPITWHVDRTCHIISASSFDKMCADMKQNYDDMSMDLHAHGARELVAGSWTANNQQSLP